MNPLLGKIVYSKAGRDKGKIFVIINIIDNDFVYISDGQLRPIEMPKKKRLKHSCVSEDVIEELVTSLCTNKKITNSEVKKYINIYLQK